jgi:small-conductance mechanosensitive channel
MSELFERVLFRIGDTPVTPGSLLIFLGVLLGAYTFSFLVRRSIRRWIHARSKVDHGTAANSLRLLHYLTLSVGLAVGLDTIGVDLAALVAAGAVVAVALGFAMQNIVQNFVSGVILLMERSIAEEHVLEVDGRTVMVKHLGIRATVARTLDDEQLIIPNSALVQSTVTNYTLGADYIRIRTLVGVAYASDVDAVFKVLADAAAKVQGRVVAREPVVLLAEFGDSSIVFEVSIWIPDPWELRRMRSRLNHVTWRGLRDAGIIIAFPQLDLYVKEFPPVPDRRT